MLHTLPHPITLTSRDEEYQAAILTPEPERHWAGHAGAIVDRIRARGTRLAEIRALRSPRTWAWVRFNETIEQRSQSTWRYDTPQSVRPAETLQPWQRREGEGGLQGVTNGRLCAAEK